MPHLIDHHETGSVAPSAHIEQHVTSFLVSRTAESTQTLYDTKHLTFRKYNIQ